MQFRDPDHSIMWKLDFHNDMNIPDTRTTVTSGAFLCDTDFLKSWSHSYDVEEGSHSGQKSDETMEIWKRTLVFVRRRREDNLSFCKWPQRITWCPDWVVFVQQTQYFSGKNEIKQDARSAWNTGACHAFVNKIKASPSRKCFFFKAKYKMH